MNKLRADSLMLNETVDGEFAMVADVAAALSLTVFGADNFNWRARP